jgi:hypothetical protein
MLAIQVHRHRSSPTLNRHGIMAGPPLPLVTEPIISTRVLAIYSGYRQTLHADCVPQSTIFVTAPYRRHGGEPTYRG